MNWVRYCCLKSASLTQAAVKCLSWSIQSRWILPQNEHLPRHCWDAWQPVCKGGTGGFHTLPCLRVELLHLLSARHPRILTVQSVISKMFANQFYAVCFAADKMNSIEDRLWYHCDDQSDPKSSRVNTIVIWFLLNKEICKFGHVYSSTVCWESSTIMLNSGVFSYNRRCNGTVDSWRPRYCITTVSPAPTG